MLVKKGEVPFDPKIAFAGFFGLLFFSFLMAMLLTPPQKEAPSQYPVYTQPQPQIEPEQPAQMPKKAAEPEVVPPDKLEYWQNKSDFHIRFSNPNNRVIVLSRIILYNISAEEAASFDLAENFGPNETKTVTIHPPRCHNGESYYYRLEIEYSNATGNAAPARKSVGVMQNNYCQEVKSIPFAIVSHSQKGGNLTIRLLNNASEDALLMDFAAFHDGAVKMIKPEKIYPAGKEFELALDMGECKRGQEYNWDWSLSYCYALDPYYANKCTGYNGWPLTGICQ